MRNPDNDPEKKQAYKLSLESLSEDLLAEECNKTIWFSAYASNNPHSCYHWQCDYTYAECARRGKADIYDREHKRVMDNA